MSNNSSYLKNFSSTIEGYNLATDYLDKSLNTDLKVKQFYNTKLDQLKLNEDEVSKNINNSIEKNNNLINKLYKDQQTNSTNLTSFNNKYAGAGSSFDIKYLAQSEYENEINNLKKENKQLEEQKQAELLKIKREKNQIALANHANSFDIFKKKALGVISLI